MRSKVVHTHRVLPTMFIILTPSFYLNESLTRWSRGWKDPASKPLLPYSRSFPKHPLPSLFRSRKYLCTLTPQSLAFVLLLPCIPLSLHPSSYLAIPFRPKEAKKIARCLITTLEQRGRWFNYLGAKKFPVFKNSRIPWTGDGLKLDIQRRLRNTTL